jgi:hypothetical protein
MTPNKKKKISLIILIIIAVCAVVYLGGSRGPTTQEIPEVNYQFSRDVVRSLIEINKISESEEEEIEDQELSLLMTSLRTKERLSEAREIIYKWTTNDNSQISSLAQDFVEAIDQWNEGNEARLRVARNETTNIREDTAIYKTKIEVAGENLLATPMAIAFGELALSQQNKTELIDYINTNFEKDIDLYEKYQENGDVGYTLPSHVWSVIIIRNVLSGEEIPS